MRPTNDRPADARLTDQTTDRRVTVQEAATLLGLSEDAVRSRLKRGTLRKEKGADGTVFVVLGGGENGDRPTANGDRSMTGQQTDQPDPSLMRAHLDSLREQVDYLREQLDREREARTEERRRQDTIIAQLTQANASLARRVPELEAPRATKDGHETTAGGAEVAPPRPATEGGQEGSERPSWWRRFFFGD